ncbi:T9SS type A sorting domain-containing protein [Lewinella sp. JB7]|uniref:T9SS type A sorting domain-containing protein n=1 Tax=Lewinella sp. JB7 TaxID=2962887 RepID=UPI0020CA1A61|nr:T9SS type A sorting domain-containing protein [Lewinella sp. JB7]MCP9235093.1 T9SS type A sorting domain-containing protein [Lewinella sp. JB7]
MMKTLLLPLLLALPVLLFSQRGSTPAPGEARIPARQARAAKAVADTLFPAVLLENCARSISPYFVQDTGYLIGSNIYGDVAQLQRIVHPSSSSFQVTSIQVPFVLADSAALDIYLRAVVFSEVDDDGRPTAYLGASDSLQVRDFNRDTTGGFIRFTEFTFSEPVTVDNDSFLIGIDFSNTYSDTAIQFVGLYGTAVGCGDGDNLVQVTATTSGLVFGTFADYYSADLEIPVYVAVESITTSLRNPTVADYGVTLAPNPVANDLTLSFQAHAPGDYTVHLTDLTGRRLRSSPYSRPSGRVDVRWEVGDLPTGIYVYHLDGPEGRQSGKVVKR